MSRDYKVEELIKNIARIEHAEERQEKERQKLVDGSGMMDLSTLKQSTQIRNAVDQVSARLDMDISKQEQAAHGHRISNAGLNSRWKHFEHLADMYDEYLRTYNIAIEKSAFGTIMRSNTGTAYTSMTFNDWINECKLNQEWRVKEEIPKLKASGKISKQNYELSMYIARKCLEAYQVYLNATEKQQITMV